MFELSYIGNSSNKKGHIDGDIYTYNYIYMILYVYNIYMCVSLIENGVPLKSSGIFMGIRPAPPDVPPQINKETIIIETVLCYWGSFPLMMHEQNEREHASLEKQ